MIIAVLDASALLAVIMAEPGADIVAPLLSQGAVSAVNMGEVATKLVHWGYSDDDVRHTIDGLRCNTIPFEGPSAVAAGLLFRSTRHAGLSLGDRACLSLARELSVTAFTADRAWQKVAQDFDIQFIR